MEPNPKVKIISDSTCDLSQELTAKYDIDILPLHILLGENEFRDGKDITPERIFAWADANKATPKTSAPSLEDAKALLPILIPLFVSAFRRADELALAMECRCYHGGEGRTRMKQMKLHGRDLISGVATAAVFAGVILLNKYVNLLPTIW